MNVTLTLDDDLVKKVRKIAVDRDTTLAGLVREHLQGLVAEPGALPSAEKLRRLEAIEKSFDRFQFPVGKIDWKREDLHERGTKKR
ncbi:MAG: CopG family transcriptional regulator [Bryobacteraceae bacterium]